jgi:hypothetical protein
MARSWSRSLRKSKEDQEKRATDLDRSSVKQEKRAKVFAEESKHKMAGKRRARQHAAISKRNAQKQKRLPNKH